MKKVFQIIILALLVSWVFKVFTQTKATPQISTHSLQMVGYWNKDKARVFTVFTPDLNWEKMVYFGRSKPWTKGRSTTVFFFNVLAKTPDVTLWENPYAIPDDLAKNCAAIFVKDPNGQETFKQFPMKENVLQ